MNFLEIKNAVEHLQKTSKCLHCEAKYDVADIFVVATTNSEGLFETKCHKCGNSTVVTMMLSSNVREKGEILTGTLHKVSQNDVLDVRNFLRNFDGDFKRIFQNHNN